MTFPNAARSPLAMASTRPSWTSMLCRSSGSYPSMKVARGQLRLQVHPGLEQVKRMGAGVVEPQVHAAQPDLRRQRRHEDTPTRPRADSDKTAPAKDPQRLAHNHRADAEPDAQ
jgi:hypothetical protein